MDFEAWYANLDPSNQDYIRVSLIEQHFDTVGYKYTRDTLSFMTIAQRNDEIPKVRDIVSKLKSDRRPVTLEPYMPKITFMGGTYIH